MSGEGDILKFTHKSRHRMDLLIRAVGIKTFSAIIKDTPVGDPDLWKSEQGKPIEERRGPEGYVGGRLRANWHCSLGMPDTSADESTEHGRAIPAAVAKCQQASRKDTLWLTNSLPYAHRIEYDGHSRQAPAGMVRRNVARIKTLISRELGKIKRAT